MLIKNLCLAVIMVSALQVSAAEKANIIVILADDLGYSDLGCYGSEIHTPTLDRLAHDGLRFTQFYNSARCCPSRASLLSGQYPQAVGYGGMSGTLPKNCVTIPEVMRTAGYRTLMSGKWHLNPRPTDRGFDEFFGMEGGYGSFWQQSLYSRLPDGHAERTYAPGTFYATDAITDYAIDFISQARRDAKPYFLYLSYNAPHFPLQAPKEDIEKYTAVYQQGWDAIREQRYARMQKLGVIEANEPLSPLSLVPMNSDATANGWKDKSNPRWESLPAERRADLAQRMAIYAAMIDRMDQGIGRVVADLEKSGELSKTLIIFLSDNGADAEWDPWGFDVPGMDALRVNTRTRGWDRRLFTKAELNTMGGPGTYHSYGSGWANASNTPFRMYKHYAHEGGISTPLIVHWPEHMTRKNEIDQRPGFLFDVMATCVEASGAQYPTTLSGHAIMPMSGRSLLPAMRGEADAARTLFFEHEGNKAVREGEWKLVALSGKPWELYHITSDRVEMHDVAAAHPDEVKRLSEAWNSWKKKCQASAHGSRTKNVVDAD